MELFASIPSPAKIDMFLTDYFQSDSVHVAGDRVMLRHESGHYEEDRQAVPSAEEE